MKSISTFPLMFLILLSVESAFAQRTAIVPPLNLFGRVDLTRNSMGTALTDAQISANWGTPARVGNIISVDIDLVNLSSVTQTGTISFIGGSMKAAAFCSFGSSHYFLTAVTVLCGTGSNNTHAEITTAPGNSGSFTTTQFPSQASWTLAPNATATLKAQLWLEGTKGNSATTGCPLGYSFQFSPRLKITVDQDKGAVLGTLVYHAGAMNEAAGSATCSGRSFPESKFGGDAPDYPPAPISINGGRPF